MVPFKVNLNVSHVGRHIYQDFQMTFAHDPELEFELMSKMLTFSLFAHPEIKVVTSSKSSHPPIWQKSITDEVIQWLETAPLNEKALRKAISLSKQVRFLILDNADNRQWSHKTQVKFRDKNIEVWVFKLSDSDVILNMVSRSMKLSAYVEDNMILLSNDDEQVEVAVERIL